MRFYLKIQLVFLFGLTPIFAFGQGSTPSGLPVVTNPAGQPIPNVSVAICTTDPGPSPIAVCSSLAPTYTDITLGHACTGVATNPPSLPLNNRSNPTVGTGCSNPGLGDAFGNVAAFVAAGTYFCEYYGANLLGFSAQPCIAANLSSGTIVGSPTVGTQVVGNGSQFTAQLKPSYDTRDWGFICNGTVYNTAAAQSIVNAANGAQANLQIQQPNCGIGDFVFPANFNLDYAPGGSLNTLTDSTTTPGNGTYDSTAGATGQCQSNNTSPTCAMAVTAIANDSYAIVCMRGFSSGAPLSEVSTASSDIFLSIPGTATSQTSINVAWLVPNVTSGARTFTVTFTSNLVGACSAIPISGLGPTPWLDGSGSNSAGINSPMSSGAGTFLSGSFLLAFGGNNNTAETCTAGAGFTQVPGAAGNSTNTNSVLCVEYQNSASAGPTTATQSFTPSPAGHNWAYQIIGLRPSSAHVIVLGSITNPNNHQIFLNATGTAGVVDFTGNLSPIDIYPEWWGASSVASDTTNLAALQASEHGAYGTNRVNGSGLGQYNKNWVLTQPYHINGEIQMYHVIGVPGARAQMICKGGGAIIQDAANQRILAMQSVAYWDMHGCNLSTTASQDAAHPLVDDDFDGVTTAGDLAPQFTTFDSVTWNGNNIAAIGLLGAKSGGGAQYSNIYSPDNEMLGFTQACYQVGTPSNLATNALAIGWSGDMQSCPQYGIALYGAGYVSISAGSNGMSSMENGFSTQTGFDIFASQNQGPCVIEHFRSESRKFAACNILYAKDVQVQNQASSPVPGSSDPVGTYKRGSYVAGDGAWYKVTVDGGPYSGAGSVTAPLQASSGTATTLVDTNQSVPGSVTIGTFTLGETATQATTGATGTVTVVPFSFSTITGTLTSGTFQPGETVTQATTGITATVFGSASSTRLFVTNLSGVADNSHTWTGGTSGATFAPSSTPSASVANPSLLLSSVAGGPDGSHNWTGGISGAIYVPSGAPVAQVNWTVNAFVGQFVSALSGTNGLCYGTVSANTATSITLSGGWSTQYQYTNCSAPDATTAFVVEPGWTHTGTVTSGGMVMQYSNENTIQGDGLFDSGVSGGLLENVNVPGGQVHLGGLATGTLQVRNLVTSRADWYVSAGGSDPQQGFGNRDWDVQAYLPLGSKPISWAYPSITGVTYKGALHRDLGAKVLCWSVGTIGLASPSPGNTSANDVCIGVRTDLGASTSATRNNLGFIGAMSCPTAFGTDQNGCVSRFMGGLPTGAGTPGDVALTTGNAGSSGTTVIDGTDRWLIKGPTGHLFANADNSYDIGASGANRPRNLYLSNSLNVQDAGTFGSMHTQTSAACETSFGASTLNVGGTTTDTGLNCLPANSIIDAVVYRITVTITTAASFTIGDATTAARFCGTQSTLTAGTTAVCFAQADQTGAPGPRQVSGAKVRVTTNANPGAGAIRLIVYYHTWTAPTS